MRTILSPDAIHPDIKSEVGTYHADIVQEVTKSVAENRVVVVGMKYNDAVHSARKALSRAGIEFTYLEYGGYASQWRRRLALKMWTGWPTFPMVFIDQTLIGGGSDLRTLLKEDGSLTQPLTSGD